MDCNALRNFCSQTQHHMIMNNTELLEKVIILTSFIAAKNLITVWDALHHILRKSKEGMIKRVVTFVMFKWYKLLHYKEIIGQVSLDKPAWVFISLPPPPPTPLPPVKFSRFFTPADYFQNQLFRKILSGI